jgi:hypothetical protein
MQKHIDYATAKLRAAKDCKLVATVNHRDNFHLWAASQVFSDMTDSMEVMTKDDNIPLFNTLCEECNRREHDVQYRYSTVNGSTQKMERDWNNHTPTKSPTIRAICDVVYDEMNKA